MTPSFIEIKNLSKVYQSSSKKTEALKDISFELAQGEIFGLLGQNGAGKTTLSSILATLHPATRGDILFQGESIYKNINGFRQSLGFCPQSQNLDPYLTVEENLLFAGRYFLMKDSDIKQRIQKLYHELELSSYAQSKPNELSGGTRQRVLIARALIHNPKLVILDEPTVGLDPDIRKKLWAIIKNLKSKGITVILTTHYLDEAEQLSDRICILHKGVIKLIASVYELKQQHNQDTLEDIFLELIQMYAKE